MADMNGGKPWQVIQSIVAALIIMLLAWIGAQTQQAAVGIARLEERVTGLAMVNSERLNLHDERIRRLERFHQSQ